MTTLTAGDKLKSVTVLKDSFDDYVRLTSLYEGKKGLLIGVPAAFSPVCHGSHLPSYIENYDKLKEKGIEVFAIISINDGFVMTAWQAANKLEEKMSVLADPKGNFITAYPDLGTPEVATLVVPEKHMCRFVALIEDNVIKNVSVDPTVYETKASDATVVLSWLQ